MGVREGHARLFAEPNAIKRDEIAGRQTWLLQQHLPGKKKLRLSDVHEMLQEMKDHA